MLPNNIPKYWGRKFLSMKLCERAKSEGLTLPNFFICGTLFLLSARVALAISIGVVVGLLILVGHRPPSHVRTPPVFAEWWPLVRRVIAAFRSILLALTVIVISILCHITPPLTLIETDLRYREYSLFTTHTTEPALQINKQIAHQRPASRTSICNIETYRTLMARRRHTAGVARTTSAATVS
jgi:hypothetical protein